MSNIPTEQVGASDAELITRVRSGDRAAFGTLYERHVTAATTLARQFARSPSEVDDLVSQAFAKVLDQLIDGRGPDTAFRAYLFTTLRHSAFDGGRKDKKLQFTDDVGMYESPEVPDDPVLLQLENTLVAKAFAALPERWQTVLWHSEVEQQSAVEIGLILGISANAVTSLTFRAREGLRAAYLQAHLADTAAEACRRTVDRLGAWARASLSKREHAQVDAHLRECERCQVLAAELADINSGLRALLAPVLLGGAAAGYLATSSSTTAAPLIAGAGVAAETGAGMASAGGVGSVAAGGAAAGGKSAGGVSGTTAAGTSATTAAGASSGLGAALKGVVSVGMHVLRTHLVATASVAAVSAAAVTVAAVTVLSPSVDLPGAQPPAPVVPPAVTQVTSTPGGSAVVPPAPAPGWGSNPVGTASPSSDAAPPTDPPPVSSTPTAPAAGIPPPATPPAQRPDVDSDPLPGPAGVDDAASTSASAPTSAAEPTTAPEPTQVPESTTVPGPPDSPRPTVAPTIAPTIAPTTPPADPSPPVSTRPDPSTVPTPTTAEPAPTTPALPTETDPPPSTTAPPSTVETPPPTETSAPTEPTPPDPAEPADIAPRFTADEWRPFAGAPGLTSVEVTNPSDRESSSQTMRISAPGGVELLDVRTGASPVGPALYGPAAFAADTLLRSIALPAAGPPGAPVGGTITCEFAIATSVCRYVVPAHTTLTLTLVFEVKEDAQPGDLTIAVGDAAPARLNVAIQPGMRSLELVAPAGGWQAGRTYPDIQLKTVLAPGVTKASTLGIPIRQGNLVISNFPRTCEPQRGSGAVMQCRPSAAAEFAGGPVDFGRFRVTILPRADKSESVTAQLPGGRSITGGGPDGAPMTIEPLQPGKPMDLTGPFGGALIGASALECSKPNTTRGNCGPLTPVTHERVLQIPDGAEIVSATLTWAVTAPAGWSKDHSVQPSDTVTLRVTSPGCHRTCGFAVGPSQVHKPISDHIGAMYQRAADVTPWIERTATISVSGIDAQRTTARATAVAGWALAVIWMTPDGSDVTIQSASAGCVNVKQSDGCYSLAANSPVLAEAGAAVTDMSVVIWAADPWATKTVTGMPEGAPAIEGLDWRSEGRKAYATGFDLVRGISVPANVPVTFTHTVDKKDKYSWTCSFPLLGTCVRGIDWNYPDQDRLWIGPNLVIRSAVPG